MPSPLEEWELKNIGYFVNEFLKLKFRNAALKIVSPLDERDEKEYIMAVQSNKPLIPKMIDNEGMHIRKLRLPDMRTIDIQISSSRRDEALYKIYIQSADLIPLRNAINNKIIKILNQYFIGEAVKQWEIHEEFVAATAPLSKKLAATPEFRLFQIPKIKHIPELMQKLLNTIAFVFLEMANYIVTKHTHKDIVQKSLFGGIIGSGSIPNQGLYIYYRGYSLEKLCDYHNKRNEHLFSIVEWIKNAFKHSNYNPSQFSISQPLEQSANKNKYTMVVSIKNDCDLPRYLLVAIDNWRVIFKSLALGSFNDVKHYKFTLSTTVVTFLNNYFYKRATDALNEFFAAELNHQKCWLPYATDATSLSSKACITLYKEEDQSHSLKPENLKLLWKKFTGQDIDKIAYVSPKQDSDKKDIISVKEPCAGDVEIIRNDEKNIIGFFYRTTHLEMILAFLQRLELHLSPTPKSQIDTSDTYQYVNARLFDGTSYEKSLPKSVNPILVPPPPKHARFAEETTQSPASFIFDESNKQIDPDALANHFPKKLIAQKLQFFKARSYKGITTATSGESPSQNLLPPLSPPRSLSSQSLPPKEERPSRKRSHVASVEVMPSQHKPYPSALSANSAASLHDRAIAPSPPLLEEPIIGAQPSADFDVLPQPDSILNAQPVSGGQDTSQYQVESITAAQPFSYGSPRTS